MQMTLRQEKEKGCVCADRVNAKSVLLPASMTKGFAVLLEAKSRGWYPPHHTSLGAGRLTEEGERVQFNIWSETWLGFIEML